MQIRMLAERLLMEKEATSTILVANVLPKRERCPVIKGLLV
jgi:hypothetical protein